MATDAAEFAPAKINLTLHVTGQRADGYHLLDSLVVFAEVGDQITAHPAAGYGLTITGPQATALVVDDDNLVLRAARLIGVEAALTLHKVLPIASGIGGGSSDAAATLRVLSRLGSKPLPDPAAILRLGADVPVCLTPRALRMQGVGERLSPVPQLPKGWLVLVNPRVGLPTPAVFKTLPRKDNPPMPDGLGAWSSIAEMADFLRQMRNDLEPAAIALAPVIDEVRQALAAQPGCLIARMSGSGATCFGLFAEEAAAQSAARAVQAAQPGWWVAAARIIS